MGDALGPHAEPLIEALSAADEVRGVADEEDEAWADAPGAAKPTEVSGVVGRSEGAVTRDQRRGGGGGGGIENRKTA